MRKDETDVLHAGFRAWSVVLIASLFFFYEFIQLNLFNAISADLMRAFHIDAAKLGDLSSFYFIANVIFLLAAGALLDRFSTRRVILFTLAICIIGTYFFSLSTSFSTAAFFRFLTGIGSAFCFLSVIRLASRWFPPHRMAFITGLIVTIAMMGGMTSQTPMTLLTHSMGWRTALQIDAVLGLLIFALIFFVVSDYPKQHMQTHEKEQAMIQSIGYFKSLRMAFLRGENWLAGLMVCLLNFPVGLLGGLWGVLYLMDTRALTHVQASTVSSMLFLGTIVGAPIMGWVSDKIQLRRPPMLVGALAGLLFIFLVMHAPLLSYDALIILFFAIGLFTSAQVIGYPLVAENSPRVITAMSVSVVNISVQGGDALFQPFYGYLMDKHMWERQHILTPNFIASDFHWAMWIFPIGFVIAIAVVFALHETRCQQRK